MSTNQPAATASSPPASASSPAPAAAKPASAGRLIVLLGVLGLATAALAYDNLVAKPGVEAAEKKINDYADERNRKGAKESGPITPDDIHQVIGMQPTFVEKHPDKHYMVEYYCWWGRLPVIDVRTGNRRHFIAIVYIGDKTMRFSSHHKNEVPSSEALPITDIAPQAAEETTPLPAPDAPGAPAANAPSDEPAAK